MTMEEIEVSLWAVANADDQELAHIEADKLLIAALRQCMAPGYETAVENVIKAFEAVPKWYS